LEYVVAVAETLHFHGAARKCHVSQPSLSSQIMLLEKRLGVRVFERDRRRVILTRAGEEIVRRARIVLEQMRSLEEFARCHDKPLQGTLHLGVIPTVAPYLLPRILGSIRRKFPQLRLHLYEDLTDRLMEKLRVGQLDLLLLAILDDFTNVVVHPLFEDRFLLAVPPGHRLAGRKRVQTRDLQGENVLLLEDGHCLRNQTLSLCHRAGAAEMEDFRAGSLGTLVQMVRGGLGITLLPSIAVNAETRSGRSLVLLPFPEKGASREIGLVWRKTTSRTEEFQLFGRSILEVLRRVSPGPGRRRPAGSAR